MKLRAQILWFGVVSLGALFLLEAAVGSLILLPAADEADRRDMEARLTRLESRLAQQTDLVRVYGNEYGPWTDTVEFIAGEKPDYVEANLNGDSLRGARIDVVAIWDADGRRVVARAYDRETEETRELTAEEMAALDARPGLQRRTVGETLEGVLPSPSGLLLFSAQPVTRDDREPPSRGTFFAAQILDEALLERLLAGETHRARVSETTTGADVVRMADERTMEGTLALADGAGEIVLTAERAARAAQVYRLRSVFVSLVVAWALFAALAWIVIKRRFIWRIESLMREVRGLETDAAVRARLAATKGDDELSLLARTTGEMAGKLAHAREAAEEAARAKGAFLAAMSHELRTPLNGVLGYTGLLKETALTAEQSDHVRVIEDSGDVLLGVINEILDFSKLESGRVELESIPTDVREIVGEVAALFAPRLKTKDVRMTAEIAPDVPERVLADPLRLRQVLTNLAGNAVKFTAAGFVTIRVNTWRGESEGLSFEVRDSGIGMTTTQLERIFNPFSQADSSTTRRYGGTGLGLAICQRLVRAWGGALGVKSEAGRGATFVFTMPARTVAVAAPAETMEAPASEKRAPLRILMAEDNAVNARLLTALLKKHGYEAQHVENGSAALAAMEEREFDLVLMDVQMPSMDGLEATRRRRDRERETGGARLYIVALTANALAGAREECVAAGMDDYLAKPYQPAQLSLVLERAAARRTTA